MAIEEGEKVTGKVSGITNFGAFVDLDYHQTGLVHISQISNHYVKDVHDVLSVGDNVTVMVTKVGDDGKIALSMKALQNDGHEEHEHHRRHDFHEHDHREHSEHFHQRQPRGEHSNRGYHGGFGGHHEKSHFDDMLASYMKESESRLSTLKRQTDGKRGGRGGRRS